jgi:hypothetical protein
VSVSTAGQTSFAASTGANTAPFVPVQNMTVMSAAVAPNPTGGMFNPGHLGSWSIPPKQATEEKERYMLYLDKEYQKMQKIVKNNSIPLTASNTATNRMKTERKIKYQARMDENSAERVALKREIEGIVASNLKQEALSQVIMQTPGYGSISTQIPLSIAIPTASSGYPAPVYATSSIPMPTSSGAPSAHYPSVVPTSSGLPGPSATIGAIAPVTITVPRTNRYSGSARNKNGGTDDDQSDDSDEEDAEIDGRKYKNLKSNMFLRKQPPDFFKSEDQQDIELWLHHLELHMKAMKCNREGDKILCLMKYLGEKPKADIHHAMQEDEKFNYEKHRDFLVQTYKKDARKMKLTFKNQFRVRTQKATETAEQFLKELKILRHKGWPDEIALEEDDAERLREEGMNDQETQIMDRFTRGLHVKAMREKFERSWPKKQRMNKWGLKELLEYAQCMETDDTIGCKVHGLDAPHRTSQCRGRQIRNVEKDLDMRSGITEDGSKEVCMIQTAPPDPGNPNPPAWRQRSSWQQSSAPRPITGNCYNCQKPGHISRNCTEPRTPRVQEGPDAVLPKLIRTLQYVMNELKTASAERKPMLLAQTKDITESINMLENIQGAETEEPDSAEPKN